MLNKRQSVRKYKKQEVDQTDLQTILEAAHSAPSAGNLQAYKIFVVGDEKQKKLLAKVALGQGFVAKAPVVLVFSADPSVSAVKYGQRGQDLYSVQDATIAAAYAWLALVELGLAAVWVGAFDEQEINDVLGASQDLRPVVVMPVGYANEKPSKPARKWRVV